MGAYRRGYDDCAGVGFSDVWFAGLAPVIPAGCAGSYPAAIEQIWQIWGRGPEPLLPGPDRRTDVGGFR
jgi:hypothetical protein